MKKITFVQRSDSSSYDPVSTFFSKTKPQSVSKPSSSSTQQSLSSKSSSIKPPVGDRLRNQVRQHHPSTMTQKIMGRKQPIPTFNPNTTNKKSIQTGCQTKTQMKVDNNTNKTSQQQYQKLYQQTIYDLREKQKQLNFNNNKKVVQKQINYQELRKNQNIPTNNNNMKQNIQQQKNNNKKFEKRPQMVFDFGDQRRGEEGDYVQDGNINQGDKNQKSVNKDDDQRESSSSSNRLPQITKGPIVQSTSKRPQTPSSKIKIPSTKNTNNINNITKNSTNTVNKPNTTNITTIKPSVTTTTTNNTKTITTTKTTTATINNNNDKPSSSSSQHHQNQQQYNQSVVDQYQRKIEQLSTKIQSLTKTQQKYNKLVKQHKQCKQRNTNYTKLQNQLKQTKHMLNKLLSPQQLQQQHTHHSIPYSTKRELLLSNQINKLKKTNRQLVLRIKNYKGSDLVSMAMANNKQEICRQIEVGLDDGQQECFNQKCKRMNIQMETGLKRVINLIGNYLENKISGVNVNNNNNNSNNNIITKKVQQSTKNPNSQRQFTLQQQHKYLLQLINLSQHLSLTYLTQYKISPLPQCNESAINLYAQIQHQKQHILKNHSYISKQLYKLIPLDEINFAISEMNLEIINDMGQNEVVIGQLQQRIQRVVNSGGSGKENLINKQVNNSMNSTVMNFNNKNNNSNNNRPTTSYNNNTFYNNNNKKSNHKSLQLKQLTNTILQLIKIHNKHNRISTLFYIQSITQFVYMKQILQQQLSKLSIQLNNLSHRLKQLKDIYDLGDTNTWKQTLWLYLQTNLQNLTITVPNLKLDIKQINSSYKQINHKLTNQYNRIQ